MPWMMRLQKPSVCELPHALQVEGMLRNEWSAEPDDAHKALWVSRPKCSAEATRSSDAEDARSDGRLD
jgi:hypothetical protein